MGLGLSTQKNTPAGGRRPGAQHVLVEGPLAALALRPDARVQRLEVVALGEDSGVDVRLLVRAVGAERLCPCVAHEGSNQE